MKLPTIRYGNNVLWPKAASSAGSEDSGRSGSSVPNSGGSDYYVRKRWRGNNFRTPNPDRANVQQHRRAEIEWKLVWLALGNVLKRRGIHPRFSGAGSDQALRAWMAWRPDPARRRTVLDLERTVLAQLVWQGEAMVDTRPDGTFLPLKLADRIRFDETGNPETYLWPDGKSLPAERVMHIFLALEPDQRWGVCLFDVIFDVAEERWGFVKSAGKLAKMVARLGLFIKRAGIKRVDSDTDKAQDDTVKVDWLADSITDIGPADEVFSPSVNGQPYGAQEMEHVLGGMIAQPYGLARMSVLGDYGDVNYSSARYAALQDRGVWGVYQDLIFRFSEVLYQQWPERAMYQHLMDGWYLPPPDHIDPVKTASANRILVDMGAKAVQEVILEDDRDPETTMALIEEYRKRMNDDADTERD